MLMRLFLKLLVVCLPMVAAGICEAAPTPVPWPTIKVGPHVCLSVENIAKFYGLPADVAPVNKKVKIENEKGSLEFTLDSREIMINGARNWLCFPVIAQDG